MASILIKVKYEETLRRLNVSVSEGKLVLDMVMLKEKIRSFFNIGSNAEFTMTYVDEDGDTVTLADDDDLHDIVRQWLNPLRITVNLNSSNSKEPSGNFTSLRSPQNQHPLPTLNHVCEPILAGFAKLFLDVDSKSSFSHPVAVELVKMMKDAYSDKIISPMDRTRVLPAIGSLSNVSSELSIGVNPEAGGSCCKKKEMQVQKVTEGVEFKDVQPPRGLDLNNPYVECESFPAPIGSTKSASEGSTGKDKSTTDGVEKKKDSSSEKKDDISGSMNKPLKHDRLVYPLNVEQIIQMRRHSEDRMLAQSSQSAQFAHVAADISKNTNVSGSSTDSTQGMLNVANQCSFPGTPSTNDTDSQGHHRRSHSPHSKRYSLDNNSTGNIFHRGVRCDGCGVHPIIGFRFKSKVKDDYDLCDVCFAVMGNATDYIRIDHPINCFRHHLPPFKGFYDHSPHTMWVPGSKPSGSKLNSRFILDVNVLDGTIMDPLTAFTKIWRMKNNGSLIWPYGSQLQWIGGDRLSNSDSVDVEIPLDGLPVDKELDIAVDFTAPELPGPYVSYWRMASPSGQKFGQRVWVLIQVDASIKNSGETSINLNLPPVMNDPEAVNQDHVADNIFPINDSLIIDNSGLSNTLVTHSPPPGTASSSVFNYPEVGTALGSLPAGPTVGLDTEPICHPTVDFKAMPPFMSTGASSLSEVVAPPVHFKSLDFAEIPPLPTLFVPPSGSNGGVISDDQEQALVKDLEAMGFKQKDWNTEILRMNNYDMKKTVDDLCDVSEWDPMLDELQEMGFTDDEANRRLLMKNNGSIKRVVMDLINGEKA